MTEPCNQSSEIQLAPVLGVGSWIDNVLVLCYNSNTGEGTGLTGLLFNNTRNV
jgi:hypothetical protein